MKYIKGTIILSVSSVIKKLLPIIYLLDLVSADILFYCYGPSITTYFDERDKLNHINSSFLL